LHKVFFKGDIRFIDQSTEVKINYYAGGVLDQSQVHNYQSWEDLHAKQDEEKKRFERLGRVLLNMQVRSMMPWTPECSVLYQIPIDATGTQNTLALIRRSQK
jgi:hypothetical protein